MHEVVYVVVTDVVTTCAFSVYVLDLGGYAKQTDFQRALFYPQSLPFALVGLILNVKFETARTPLF